MGESSSSRRTAPSTTRHVSLCTHLRTFLTSATQEEYLNGWLKGWLKKHSHDAEYLSLTNSHLIDLALTQVPPGAARGWFIDAGY